MGASSTGLPVARKTTTAQVLTEATAISLLARTTGTPAVVQRETSPVAILPAVQRHLATISRVDRASTATLVTSEAEGEAGAVAGGMIAETEDHATSTATFATGEMIGARRHRSVMNGAMTETGTIETDKIEIGATAFVVVC